MTSGSSFAVAEDGRLYRLFKESLLTGVAVVVPGLLTLYLLKVALTFFAGLVTPVARLVLLVVPVDASYLLVDAGIAALMLGVVVGVGFVAHFHAGERAIGYVDRAIMRIPVAGTVYENFRRMSDVVLTSDQRSFREVRLLEFPGRDSYTLAFEVMESPPELASAADADSMETLFVPFAPNPVMGGFLVHVPDERVLEVDMTVEEAIGAIISLGATEGEPAADVPRLSTPDRESR